MATTRGLRNNNPLNIRRNKTKWKGLATEQRDTDFFSFIAPEWGYRAALITLKNYKRIHNLHTISEWITRWAPPIENNTDAYIRCVCNRCYIKRDTIPDINNRNQMCDIIAAMSYMENGIDANREHIEKAWTLI